MKLCSGSLRDVIDKSKVSSSLTRSLCLQGLGEGQFIQYLEDVCTGLVFLHSKAIIFNDLKPDNLLIDPSDTLVLADFGDARRFDSSNNGPALYPHALGWGDPVYHCCPDVMRATLSLKSDLWMLAQLASHMWTGSAPKSNPCRLDEDMPLRGMLGKCLSNLPKDRPTVSQMLSAIRQLIKEEEDEQKHQHVQQQAQEQQQAQQAQQQHALIQTQQQRQEVQQQQAEQAEQEAQQAQQQAFKQAQQHSQQEQQSLRGPWELVSKAVEEAKDALSAVERAAAEQQAVPKVVTGEKLDLPTVIVKARTWRDRIRHEWLQPSAKHTPPSSPRSRARQAHSRAN
eukprot:TRINITY_DN729_c0_g1_i1.p1 TRINITY_DN729_c0_g1~~TRINITY_DN729_c0_g1_i1.p1  ORF type:complete len:340 (+),score=81.74 TRINITY_DN729_c0_g1_i1:561-1580(+)